MLILEFFSISFDIPYALHLHRGFVNVQGNLNKRTFGKDIFLWYRPIKSRQVSRC